jgi:hypothetical protein
MKSVVLFAALPITICVWSLAIYGLIKFLGW